MWTFPILCRIHKVMLDIKFIRENPEVVKEGARKKQMDPTVVDRLLTVDETRRQLIQKVDDLRSRRNQLTKDDRDEGLKIKEEIKKIEPQLKEIEAEFKKLMYEVPNFPAPDVKEGKDEKENEVIRKFGEPKNFNFEIHDYMELGKSLDIIDIERATKVSGARFGYLKGEAVLLEFALVNFALQTLIKEGFEPIVPPVLLKVPVFHSLGYSEHMGNEDYYLVSGGDGVKNRDEEESEYYLVGTAEHAVVPFYKDEVLLGSNLPKRFIAFSTCFRREAGSYGKDTKGILRVHQFDKVEMVSFTKTFESEKEHEYLLSLEEKLLQSLNIPYQVVKMCSGDLGAPAAKKYDLEAWFPSQGKYRELTSTSTTTDFQARRLNIKYRDGDKVEFVHILNGTAFAIGRTIIAILENYQNADGSVTIPEVLRDYVGKDKILPPNKSSS